ncbi:1,4-alpha-glucan branching protein GlgB (plasmid) [Paroceanicella profunda]|uniref:1,4-alpha-glucan branching enzyme GlgB n=2 Tax=Paroceanicella profunda TaxID=2579971 RepID=A0A5B8G2Y3_9RHOB|nr:1,4-alpha-glucan branching protein GlgB [Paroceanicella profunda]
MSAMQSMEDAGLVAALAADAMSGRMENPFAAFGPRAMPDGRMALRSFQPGAEAVEVIGPDGTPLGRLEQAPGGLFFGVIEAPATEGPAGYVLRIHWPGGVVQETEDPYAFGLLLGDLDLHLFSEGRHFDMGRVFGAVPMTVEGVAGTRFSVWAPNALMVSVIGDFNGWDGRRHPMRLRHGAGVWELFLPRLGPGARYKFQLRGAGGAVFDKADPIARATERPPGTASVVAAPPDYAWSDADWMETRAARAAQDAPISVYEVHSASWLRPGPGPNAVYDWDGLAERLVPYAALMGFTHLELMPVMEHPFGGSWGYQPLSQFAPTARHGAPEGFARFVDTAHRAGLGVILDWVPGHFPTDPYGLARFDGSPLYEHADPREGFHHDWNTYIYNLGRREVSGFLLASAIWWLKEFHVDGLRVDAVASMLYRDYSRKHDEWVPNVYGGRENLETVSFFRSLSTLVAEHAPGAVTIAEESTAWPGVTAPVTEGGLGFDYKWNMGWMHDTLLYTGRDPVHRRWHHDEMTFGLVYAFSEAFVLPISHDEVVYGKGSLYERMPGDDWTRRAGLRAYLAFMWMHPGKKLLFMGQEFGQPGEWNHDAELPWDLLSNPGHAGIQALVRALNALLRDTPALHRRDTRPDGFAWVVGADRENSVFAWTRSGEPDDVPVLVVLNMTPAAIEGYRIGVARPGRWREVLNTDAAAFGGSNLGNAGGAETAPEPAHGQPHSLSLTLPPLSAVVFTHEDDAS